MSDEPAIWFSGGKAIYVHDDDGYGLAKSSDCCCKEECSITMHRNTGYYSCYSCTCQNYGPPVEVKYTDDQGEHVISIGLINGNKRTFTVYGKRSAFSIVNLSEVEKCSDITGPTIGDVSSGCSYDMYFTPKFFQVSAVVHFAFYECQISYVYANAPSTLAMYIDGINVSVDLKKNSIVQVYPGRYMVTYSISSDRYCTSSDSSTGESAFWICACELLDLHGNYRTPGTATLGDVSSLTNDCRAYITSNPDYSGWYPRVECTRASHMIYHFSEELEMKPIRFAMVSACSIQYEHIGTVTFDFSHGAVSSKFCNLGPYNPFVTTSEFGATPDEYSYSTVWLPGPRSELPSDIDLLHMVVYSSANPYSKISSVSYYKSSYDEHGKLVLTECLQDGCNGCDTIVFYEYNPVLSDPKKANLVFYQCSCCLLWAYNSSTDMLVPSPPNPYTVLRLRVDYPEGEFEIECNTNTGQCTMQSTSGDSACYVCSYDFPKTFKGFPVCSNSATKIGSATLIEACMDEGTDCVSGEQLKIDGKIDDVTVDIAIDQEGRIVVAYGSSCGTSEDLVPICDSGCPCPVSYDITEIYTYTVCDLDHSISPPYHWKAADHPSWTESYIPFPYCDNSCLDEHRVPAGWLVINGAKHHVAELMSSQDGNACIDPSNLPVTVEMELSIKEYDPTIEMCCNGEPTKYPGHVEVKWLYSKYYEGESSATIDMVLDSAHGVYRGRTSVPCSERNLASYDFSNFYAACLRDISLYPAEHVPAGVCAKYVGVLVRTEGVYLSITVDVNYSPLFPSAMKNPTDKVNVTIADHYKFNEQFEDYVANMHPMARKTCSELDCGSVEALASDVSTPPGNFIPVTQYVTCYGSNIYASIELEPDPDVLTVTVNLNGGSGEASAASTRGARSPTTGTIVIYVRKNSDIPPDKKPGHLHRDGYTFSRFKCTDCTEDNNVDEDGWPTHITTTSVTVECVWVTTATLTVVLGDSAPDLPAQPGSPYDKSKRSQWPNSATGAASLPVVESDESEPAPTEIQFTLNRASSRYEAVITFEVMDMSNPNVPFSFAGNESVGPADGSATFGPSTGYVGTAVTHFTQIWHQWTIRPDYWFQTACDPIYYPKLGGQNIFGFSMVMRIEDQSFTFTTPVGSGDTSYPSFMCDEYGKVGCETIRVCKPTGLFHYDHPFYAERPPKVEIDILGTSPSFVEVAEPFNRQEEMCDPGGSRIMKHCSDGPHPEVAKDCNDRYDWPHMSCLWVVPGSGSYAVLVEPNVMIKYAGSGGGGGGGGGGGDDDPKKWPWSVMSFDSEWMVSYNGADSGDSTESEASKYSVTYAGEDHAYQEYRWTVVDGSFGDHRGHLIAYNGQGEGDPDNYVTVYYGESDSNDSNI